MRILIAEDDPVSRRLLEATLVKWGYEVVITVDGNEAWKGLQQRRAPPLAILDWMMPGVDGLEVCRRVRRASSSQIPYIIMLTAAGGKEKMVEGLSAGADDYVTKPFDPDELHARMRVGERVLGSGSSLTDLNSVTEVYNLPLFRQLLENEVEWSYFRDCPCSLLMAEIDDFDAHTSNRNTSAGVEPLRIFVAKLREVARPGDIIGQTDHGEFGLILRQTMISEARELAERIRNRAGCKISAGIACFPRDANDARALFRTARAAKGAARARGGDMVLIPR